jgi:hypothetical protein
MSCFGIARPLSRLALCGVVFAPSLRRVSQCRWVGVKATPHRAERGLVLTQEPCGLTLRSLPRREERPQRGRCRPSDPAHRGRPTPVLGGSPGRLGRAATGSRQERRSRLHPGAKRSAKPPWGVEGGEEVAARAERSDAGAFRVCPLGGSAVRQGATAVRARCRADGGPERGLAAPWPAGAVRRRRRLSRCTDRSAGGCADRRTAVTARAPTTAAGYSAPL